MNAFITYDLPKDFQVNFKNKMVELGYSDSWYSNEKRYLLPESTLWKLNTTLEQAYNDSIRCARELGTEFSRLIVVPATPWIGIYGKQ